MKLGEDLIIRVPDRPTVDDVIRQVRSWATKA